MLSRGYDLNLNKVMKFIKKQHCKQQGAILILVLWFIVIITVMVATLASETRLSAQIVYYNKAGLLQWNDLLTALNIAELELLAARIPNPEKDKDVPLSERKNPYFRFDGRVLEDTIYPLPKTVILRIYDHAGKINLPLLSSVQMQQLIERKIGKEDVEKIQSLLDVWQDWIDRDDLKRTNGVEKEYYEKLTPPYQPRNDILQTADELLLLKGFKELFDPKQIDMNTAFTVYGNIRQGVNPNLATREALALLPGLSEESINTILVKRREKEFKSSVDFNEFIQPEQLAEFLPWVHYNTSNYYTIAIQSKPIEAIENEEISKGDRANKSKKKTEEPQKGTTTVEQAYLVTVQVRGTNQLPKVLMVNPYGTLPDASFEALIPKEKEGSLPKSSVTAPSDTSSKSPAFPLFR